MKPIFVIQMPLGTPAEVLEKVYEQVHNKGMDEDYHVLLTIGKDTTSTFKCFNSPYTKEEYSKLEHLIKEINKDYVIEKNRRL
jgi:N-acetyl-anhydromuramyl-L-alanine amidase AmpD